MRGWHLVVAASCALGVTHDVRAEAKAVSLGEVSFSARPDSPLTPRVVSATLDELGHLDLRRARKQAVISVSVVRLDSEPRGNGATITCVVSATLRHPRTGAIFAVVEGRAQAEGDSVATLEPSVLRGALHGAIARVPDALR